MVDPDELASSAHVIHVLKIILTGGAWPGGRSKIKEGTTTATRISWYILRTSDIPLKIGYAEAGATPFMLIIIRYRFK